MARAEEDGYRRSWRGRRKRRGIDGAGSVLALDAGEL